MLRITFILLCVAWFYSCSNKSLVSLDARDDIRKYNQAKDFQNNWPIELKAIAETEAMPSDAEDDSADDPAFWFNEENPSESIMFGSNKLLGLYAYDLKGSLLDELRSGKMNNVDVRFYSKDGIDKILVGASNRTTNTIDIFEWDRDNKQFIQKPLISLVSQLNPVYGFCLYHEKSDDLFYAFVNTKLGGIEQWKLDVDEGSGELTRQFRLGSQVEGMVADDEKNLLYVGEENAGVYVFNAKSEGKTDATKLPKTSMTNNKNLSYDIEGITIFDYKNEQYLIASSQGNFSYPVYNITAETKYLNSFVITDDTIDGVEETDGIEVYSGYLNEDYPEGILIVHDGFNYEGDVRQAQNFKFVSLKDMMDVILD